MSRLHILLLHQAFVALDEAGGTRHLEFARYLVASGNQVTVIASPVSYLTGRETPSNDEVIDGVRILRAYTHRALHRSFVHRVLSFLSFAFSSFFIGLRVKEVDIVWGTTPPIFQAASAWLLARLKGARFLLEVRDLWPAFAIAVGVLRSRTLIAASEWLERFLYRRADQIMINSPGFREHIAARGGERIELVPNGADAAMFDPAGKGADFRRQHGLEGKFVVLYAGAHGLSNDLGVVVQAAADVRDQPEIAIVLLGDGKDKPALIEQARALGLDNLHFVDPLPKTAMAQALAAADACLAILKPIAMYKTVYPNKVFDYMAAGRPVLLAIDGVIRRAVEDAEAGVFVPPGDAGVLAAAIKGLASDPQAAARMGRKGRAYLMQHFNRPELASRFEALLQQLDGKDI